MITDRINREISPKIGIGVIVILILAIKTSVALPVGSCGLISSPGEYKLSNDITIGNFVAQSCIKISSNDVVFDGAGYVIGNMAVSGSYGVYVYDPKTALSNVTIKNLKVSNLSHGIYYKNAANGKIVNNYVSSNSYAGIYLDYSTNNIILNNTINWNKLGGIYINSSGGNLIYNNYFNNTNNSYFVGTISTNYWNSTKSPGINIIGGLFIGGNFWTYPNGTGIGKTCVDAERDGICDSPYTLAIDNIDYLPLRYMIGSVTNLTNKSYAQNYINWTWTDPQDSNFSKVMVYLDGKFKINVTKGKQYYNATALAAGTKHTISTRTVDNKGIINPTWVNHTAWTAPDLYPPAGVTNLTNKSYAQKYINWTWTDPKDSDFKWVKVYINGVFKTNILKGKRYYNATGLVANTSYKISTRTEDTNGNINLTWVNHTARTAPDPYPPASVTNLTNKSYAQKYINWIWTDPKDSDFKWVKVYINGVFKTNVLKGKRYYNATGLVANTSYKISTRTEDTNGNINLTWVNHTARTAP